MTLMMFGGTKYGMITPQPSNLTIMGVLGMHMSIKKLLGDSDAETYKNEFLPVDIADLEPSSHIFELRKAMINGEKGQITVNDYDISNDEHHVINRSKTYNYDKVKDFNLRFLENNVDGEIEEMLESMNATDILEYFYEKFISKNLSQNYTGFNILKSRSLWKIYPEKDAQEARSVMKKFELQFEERILKSDDAWVVDVYDAEMKFWNGTTERFLICGRNIKVHDTTLAVVAAVFRDQILRNIIIENSLTSSSSSSSSPVTSVSYLLDDGGIVITADDDEDHVGLFFGDVEPHVMKHMLENRIYRLDETTRYFSICSDLGSTDDASHITSFFSSLTYQLIIPKLFSFLHGVMVDMVFSDIEFGDEPDNRPKEYCQRNLYKYSFGTNAAKENEFSIDCQNCSKTYKTMRMRDANLMLVLVVSSHHAYDNSADGGSNSNHISDHTTDTQSNQHDNATEVKDACKCYFNESMSLPFKPTQYKDKDFLLSNFEVNSDDSLCLPFDKVCLNFQWLFIVYQLIFWEYFLMMYGFLCILNDAYFKFLFVF
ncbi:hypothetical protein HELRODRAFT_192384 [Helobdella robusta]|uniref:Voltage-dependent calcium channel alpha-2/delta subunit conserved region domain-containing protein n=1 Tax=Helobdella robusta TaxID=6412 RepID=T1FTW2_HELRO|nr:hypothetical protein HELRODRAFT_192384 [Helobdella robusta]ESO01130.1 hypothetical protein HELRODRAFT_192384 [Helobdella robusta]